MHAEWRVHAHKQLHMIGQDFQFLKASLVLLAHVDDRCLNQPSIGCTSTIRRYFGHRST
jgi:hypothetical protein